MQNANKIEKLKIKVLNKKIKRLEEELKDLNYNCFNCVGKLAKRADRIDEILIYILKAIGAPVEIINRENDYNDK